MKYEIIRTFRISLYIEIITYFMPLPLVPFQAGLSRALKGRGVSQERLDRREIEALMDCHFLGYRVKMALMAHPVHLDL